MAEIVYIGPSLTMEHWNYDQCAVVAIDVTGSDPYWNEIFNLVVLPLDSFFDNRKDVLPFDILIKPENNPPLDIKNELTNTVKKDERLGRAMLSGFSRDKAEDLLIKWKERLHLRTTKYGSVKRIIPICHDYATFYAFMVRWLGPSAYYEIFTEEYRDTKQIFEYLNDRSASRGEKVVFSRSGISYAANYYTIPHERSDLVHYANVVRQIYQKQTVLGIL
jgi:hypothetical protein